jgi:hypothetical protein
VAIFEVSEGSEGALEMANASLLTPIHFRGMDAPAYVAKVERPYVLRGGGELADDEESSRVYEANEAARAAEVERVVGTLGTPGYKGALHASRDELRQAISESLCDASEDFATVEGQRFIDRWLGMVELEAYEGDSKADMTFDRSLRAFLPPEHSHVTGLHAILSPWVESLVQAGEVARAAKAPDQPVLA